MVKLALHHHLLHCVDQGSGLKGTPPYTPPTHSAYTPPYTQRLRMHKPGYQCKHFWRFEEGGTSV